MATVLVRPWSIGILSIAGVCRMHGMREPSAREESGIAERSAHLKALLDAARAAGLLGYAAYVWDSSRPYEPCIVIAGVHIHCEMGDGSFYVIGRRRPRYVSVNHIDRALQLLSDPDGQHSLSRDRSKR